MINIALLGCGRIGQVHARAIKDNPDARVVALADAIPAAAEALAATTGAEVRSIDDIMAGKDVDAVVIGTPTTTHYDLIHTAARAGKAVFCEKPVDLSSDRIRECIKVVEETGVLIPTLPPFRGALREVTLDRLSWSRSSRATQVRRRLVTSRPLVACFGI